MVFLNVLQNLFGDCIIPALVLLLVSILFMNYWSKHWKDQPPGPVNAPFLGYIAFFLSKRPHELLANLRNKYGTTFGFYLGERYVVVLNDITSIRENLNREEFLGRPKIHPINMFEKNSIFISSGPIWKQEKRVALRIFHELGFGRRIMQERVKTELSLFMARLKKQEGLPFDMRKYLQVTVNNNISSLIFGHRYDYSDPMVKHLTNVIQEFEEENFSVDIGSYFPYLKPILRAIGQDPLMKCRSYSDIMAKIIRDEINEERKHLGDKDVRSYLHGYLMQMEKDKENTTLSEEALLGTAKVFYIAGASTTVNTIEWLLLALITNPKIQERVHQEIDEVLATKENVDWSDQKNLPYTQAIILETMRWKTLVPLSVQRCTLTETKINGYKIPSNTIILPNLWAAHSDDSVWENPEQFKPERFLDKDGKVINSDDCISFSVGRRSCPGENLARLQIFLYSVSLLKKYNVTSAKGDILDLKGIPRFTMVPKAFKILLTPRS